LRVTDGTLPLLGIPPMLGHSFTKQDDSPGAPETVMLTYGYWRRKFGGDPSAIGRNIIVDGKSRQIIGVLPQRFRFLDKDDPAVITPFQFDRNKANLGNFSYEGLARLKPGVTLEQVNADVARMLPIVMTSFPAPPGFSIKLFEDAHIGPNVRPLKRDVVGDVGSVLWVLMGSISMVLLIACANVANLLLVRVEGRRQELAVRAALGAGRGRIAADLLLESVILGLLRQHHRIGPRLRCFAHPCCHRSRRTSSHSRNRHRWPRLALHASNFTPRQRPVCFHSYLQICRSAAQHRHPRGWPDSQPGKEQHRARSVLVVVQVALALVLLICSGLMIRTFRALTNINPGFTGPAALQTFRISIVSALAKEDEKVVRMEEEISHRLAAIPGVSSVAIASSSL